MIEKGLQPIFDANEGNGSFGKPGGISDDDSYGAYERDKSIPIPVVVDERPALDRIIAELDQERRGRFRPTYPVSPIEEPKIFPPDTKEPKYLEGFNSGITGARLKVAGVDIARTTIFNPLSRNEYAGGTELTQEGIEKIKQFLKDKGYSNDALEYLSETGVFGSIFANLVLRTESNQIIEAINNTDFKSSKRNSSGYYDSIEPYLGFSYQNEAIDASIPSSDSKNDDQRRLSRKGATRLFRIGTPRVLENYKVADTPIVIIGGGPAGLLTANALVDLGFASHNITVLDKSGDFGGIWKQKNVAGGSKNNPFDINFSGIRIDAAPGPGSSISIFLRDIAKRMERNNEEVGVVKGKVTRITPGDLNHTVHYIDESGTETTLEAPIVINAIGNGKPLPPNREGYMTTPIKDGQAGIRWQQIITPEKAEEFSGKTVVFVGLGNSTAEMMQQIEDYNKLGYGINYRVLTHYPYEAIQNPDSLVRMPDGREFKVFRDIKTPNLTKFEGDLPEMRTVYDAAVRKGRIISDVVNWDVKDKSIVARTKDGTEITIPFAQLYTLIGYRQDPEALRAMGMTVVDEYTGEIAYDYDGEIQRKPGEVGRKRVHPGYFGIGAVLKSPSNPNAEVIPGIQHRLYDLLFGVIMRSAESAARKEKPQKKRR